MTYLADKRANLILWMIWLSLGGLIVSGVTFIATLFDITAPLLYVCLGILPLAVLNVVVRLVIGRTATAPVPSIVETDGVWLGVLLLSSVVVLMFNSPPGGWRRSDIPFIRVYEQEEFDRSPARATDIHQRLIRMTSWVAFVFFMSGVLSWRNLAIAEENWVSREDAPRKVRRRGSYNQR